MIQALKENKIDVVRFIRRNRGRRCHTVTLKVHLQAVALTESLIAGIVRKAADYRIVGQYVSSPLNWFV